MKRFSPAHLSRYTLIALKSRSIVEKGFICVEFLTAFGELWVNVQK